MSEQIPSNDLFSAIVQRAQILVNAETAVLALAEEAGATVFYAAAVGKHANAIIGKRSAATTSGLCGVAFSSGQSELVCQTQGDLRIRQDLAEALGIETALAVAVIHHGELLGALMVLNRCDGSAFDELAAAELANYAEAVAELLCIRTAVEPRNSPPEAI
jgi:GAF domain-containing protein